MTTSCTPVIIDFGMATIEFDPAGKRRIAKDNYDFYKWIAPEVLEEHQAPCRMSDIYSYGKLVEGALFAGAADSDGKLADVARRCTACRLEYGKRASLELVIDILMT